MLIVSKIICTMKGLIIFDGIMVPITTHDNSFLARHPIINNSPHAASSEYLKDNLNLNLNNNKEVP